VRGISFGCQEIKLRWKLTGKGLVSNAPRGGVGKGRGEKCGKDRGQPVEDWRPGTKRFQVGTSTKAEKIKNRGSGKMASAARIGERLKRKRGKSHTKGETREKEKDLK